MLDYITDDDFANEIIENAFQKNVIWNRNFGYFIQA